MTRFTAPHVVDPPISVTHRGDPQGGSRGHGVALRGHDTVQCACSVEQSEADCGLVRTQRPRRRRRGPSVTCWLLSGKRPLLIKASAAPGDTTTVNDRFCFESHSCVSCQYLSQCWPPHTPRDVYSDWVLARLCTVMTKLILVMAPACSGTAMRSLQDGLFIRVVSGVLCRWRTCERHKSPA